MRSGGKMRAELKIRIILRFALCSTQSSLEVIRIAYIKQNG